MAYQHREGAEEGDRENREREDEKADGLLVWKRLGTPIYPGTSEEHAGVFKYLFSLGRG